MVMDCFFAALSVMLLALGAKIFFIDDCFLIVKL